MLERTAALTKQNQYSWNIAMITGLAFRSRMTFSPFVSSAYQETSFHYLMNYNAPTAAVSLACLEIRSRNEEAINSTRNRIYSLKVFSLPTLSLSVLFIWFWIDSGRVLGTTGNTSAVAGFTRGFQRNYNIARDQRSVLHGISIIAENKPHANHKTHMHTMKVYNTRPSQFC